jgi:predicted enzyme related to lactoylglutathione lyase
MTVPETCVHYLEVVTSDPEAARDLYTDAYGWAFGAAEPSLGNAFVASLPDGSLCGIRAPMSEQEKPIVRTYFRVADVDQAVRDAERLGAMIALGPTELPGHGRIAIYVHGGIEQGIWQLL